MTIRTLVEVRGGRVSIVEDGDETRVTITRDEAQSGQPFYQAAVDAERELVAAVKRVGEMENQVLDLKNDLSGVRGHSEGLEDRIQALVAERDALLLKVEGYDLDRHTEKQRADENRGWAERTEALLENARRDLDNAKTKLSRIQDKVWKDTLDSAMENRGQPEHIPVVTVGDLAAAVSAVRSIVGQP
jgi:uncharacterized protein (DUF3084 family)